MLGLDLLDVACEGRVLAVVAADAADAALAAWRALPEGAGAARVGAISTRAGQVVLETRMGGHRLVDLPQGEQLPRIC
jgi:hydrogenase expression/formation protein HypE